MEKRNSLKYLKRSIYVGLAALMVAGVGATSVNGIQANAKRRARTHRVYRHHVRRHARRIHVTDRWNRTHAFRYVLNGEYSVCNKPSIYPSAHSVAKRSAIYGLRVYATKGEMVNGRDYWKVSSKKGKVQGWIARYGVNIYHGHKLAKYSASDRRNANAVTRDLIKSEMSAGYYNKEVSEKDANNALKVAKNFVNSAGKDANRINNKKLAKQFKKEVKSVRNYIKSLKARKFSGSSSNPASTSSAEGNIFKISNDLSGARNYITLMQKGKGSQRTAYTSIVSGILSDAKTDNAKVSSSQLRSLNNGVINALEDANNKLKSGSTPSSSSTSSVSSAVTTYRNLAQNLITDAHTALVNGNGDQAKSLMAKADAYSIIAAKLDKTPANSSTAPKSLKGMSEAQAIGVIDKYSGKISQSQLMALINSYYA